MTTDPERLLSASNCSPLQRTLLSSLRAATPPPDAEARVWDGLSRQIALAGLVGAALAVPKGAAASGAALTSQAPVAPSLVAKSLTTKLIAVMGIGAVSAAGTYVALAPHAPPVVDAAPPARFAAATPPVAQPSEPAPALSAEAQAPAPTTPVPAPKVAAAKLHAAQSPHDALARQSALLVQARSALRAGQIARARSLLGELQAHYGRGMLSQEREVLNIELLAASGQQQAAARRARAFIAKHPKSAHASKLARFVDAP